MHWLTDHGDHVLFSQGGNDHVLARTRLIGGPIKIYEIDTQFRHKWWTWCQQQACLNLMEEGEQLVAICQISLTRLDIASPTVRHQHLVKHGKNKIDFRLRVICVILQPKTFVRIPSMQEITVTDGKGSESFDKSRKISIAVEYDTSFT